MNFKIYPFGVKLWTVIIVYIVTTGKPNMC